MAKQRIGSIVWSDRKPGEEFKYCIGYCQECGTKQTINQTTIEEFNKRALYPKLEVGKATKLLNFVKNIKHLRLRLEVPRELKNNH